MEVYTSLEIKKFNKGKQMSITEKSVKRLNSVFQLMESIVEKALVISDEDIWKTVHLLVFSVDINDAILYQLTSLNIKLVYDDPNETCKEDVLAYYEAVKKVVEELNKLKV